MKFLWLEFGSIENVQLDFIKTAWDGKNWPVRLQKHIETKFKFYIYISICQLSLPWLDWPCIIIVVYAGLKWIGIPWKIALVWLYLFYQIQDILVFLNSLFFVTGWIDWLAPKSIYGIFILIEYASNTKPTFGSKTSWSKKHFQNK